MRAQHGCPASDARRKCMKMQGKHAPAQLIENQLPEPEKGTTPLAARIARPGRSTPGGAFPPLFRPPLCVTPCSEIKRPSARGAGR